MIFRGQQFKKLVAIFVPLLSILISTTTIVKAVRIMPLGDSITAGEHYGYPAFGERTGYRKPLYELMVANSYDVDFVGSLNWGFDITPPFDCDHEGHPEWRAGAIATNVYQWLQQNPADIILAHIDEGDPNAVLYYLWSVESAPVGILDVVFDDNTIEDPIVTFPAVGEYTLRLSASDDGPVESQESKDVGSDTITVTVEPPSTGRPVRR